MVTAHQGGHTQSASDFLKMHGWGLCWLRNCNRRNDIF
jgi:hypothetical protein